MHSNFKIPSSSASNLSPIKTLLTPFGAVSYTHLPGVLALIESSSLQPGNLNSGQIVFTIAPRINAVGRLGDAKRAVELLITNSKEEALTLAKVLETENYERRKIDVDTFDNALQLVESSIDLDNDLAICLLYTSIYSLIHQQIWVLY